MDPVTQIIRGAMKTLRETVPTIYPVRLRWADWDDCDGTANYKDGRFTITLNRKLRATVSRSWILDILAHEWAHCLCWTAEHPNFDDHGPMWGVAYAKVYQQLFEQH
jgi:predicted SprT family Zn-dependent metalloprotease